MGLRPMARAAYLLGACLLAVACGAPSLPERCPQDCAGHGDCSKDESGALRCFCHPGFGGAACSVQLGSALRFNGDGNLMEVPAMDAVEDLTVEMWVYPKVLGGWRSLYSTKDWQTGSLLIQFAGADQLEGAIGGNKPKEVKFSYRFKSRKWHHIAVVYSRGRRLVQLIVDSNVEEQADYTDAALLNMRSAWVGGWQGGLRWFAGDIDEVRVWGTARTARQIKGFAGQELEGKEEGLLAYYKFNEKGKIAADSSPNGNTGYLCGRMDPDKLSPERVCASARMCRRRVSATVMSVSAATTAQLVCVQRIATDVASATMALARASQVLLAQAAPPRIAPTATRSMAFAMMAPALAAQGMVVQVAMQKHARKTAPTMAHAWMACVHVTQGAPEKLAPGFCARQIVITMAHARTERVSVAMDGMVGLAITGLALGRCVRAMGNATTAHASVKRILPATTALLQSARATAPERVSALRAPASVMMVGPGKRATRSLAHGIAPAMVTVASWASANVLRVGWARTVDRSASALTTAMAMASASKESVCVMRITAVLAVTSAIRLLSGGHVRCLTGNTRCPAAQGRSNA